AEGSVGAGTGATVGKGAGGDTAMKGGFGCVVREAGGVYLAAMAVVNALGDVRSADGAIIAGARDRRGTFLDSSRALSEHAQHQKFGAGAGHNTTLCVVATNASLERSELAQLARAAGAALFRRITPVGTSFDGDVIFALATPDGPPGTLMSLEIHAVAALEDAIERGVRLAAGGHNVPGLADRSK
ncbi:MAG TPA: P1 family peptidase, partial [Gemmatimonadaceae bacterium]|nr:P1 family peptidase [Gemmatimonadaceae bacterium]